MEATNDRKRWGLLALGSVLLFGSQMRWGVGVFAWIAPIPLLAALRLGGGRSFRAAFAAATIATWIAATAKIVTAPVPWVIAPAYGIVVALAHLPAYALWDALVRRGRDSWAVWAFAAASTVGEWIQAEWTPAGVWGAAPGTQVGSLAILQTLALVGMPGLAFLMYAFAGAVEGAWSQRIARRPALMVAAVVAMALAWGAVRSELALAGPEVRAAMIRTESRFSGLPLPPADELRRVNDVLFERTSAAASAGARLVVWTEGATLVMPAEEPAFVARLSAAARTERVELVVAYIVPTSLAPLRYVNRLRWMAPDGHERLAYIKHHPVPAEPMTPGPSPAPTLTTSFGLASAAICYDYDFPSLARIHARGGAGVIVLPSSDWQGIDPIHTEMAAMRAIEGGFSIVRATRWGLSGGIDAHGRLRASVSTNDSRQPFTLVSLPTTRVRTLYAWLGNAVTVPMWAIVVAGLALLRRGPSRRDQRVAHAGAVPPPSLQATTA